MKAWIVALAVIAATADLKVRLSYALTAVAACPDVVQAFRPAANSTLTAIPGIKVGHYTLAERPTGCTVVLIEQGATAGVDVRGAAPATRDTDLLNPTKMVEQIFGVALSGGSTFGLSTGDGVLRYLEEKNVGIVVRQPPHSDRAWRVDLRSRRRRRADPSDRRLRLSRRPGGDRRRR